MSGAPTPVVILISGRGSNLQAILDATRAGHLPIEIRAVISNNPNADGLQRARTAGVPTEIIDHRAYSERTQFDVALRQAIDRHAPRLVILAGFMRILGEDFIRHYAGRLINIHPSLLPAFKGLNTHARALAAGAPQHGASVHFVTNDLDGGPMIVQAIVPVRAGDTADTLAARVLREEHRILPLAIRWFVEGRLSIRNGHVLLDGETRPEQGLVAAPDMQAEASK
ncbi:MAG TPA: phosphoribosylglycinamide formyltransferase [Acidiferrobacterales bacterium]|nr:phosphoribosylglycinamide formyltransferase [Acidiferrobacterales bacterium]